MKFQATAIAMTAVLSLGAVQTTDAALLKVDFGNGGAEGGFLAQTSASQLHSTTSGDVTISLTGGPAVSGLFDYSTTTGSNTALYRDFYFRNGGDVTMTISGPGIASSTAYNITFWSYYGVQGRKSYLSATAGTTGADTAVIAASNSPVPSTLYDPLYSTTGTFTSDGSNTLTLLVKGTGDRPAINAIEISIVPEPSSLALLGLGGLLIARRRRG